MKLSLKEFSDQALMRLPLLATAEMALLAGWLRVHKTQWENHWEFLGFSACLPLEYVQFGEKRQSSRLSYQIAAAAALSFLYHCWQDHVL